MIHFHNKKHSALDTILGTKNKKELMGIPMALMLSAGISAGGGLLGGLLGGGDEEEWDPQYLQLPDYPEATGAREDWWSKLQEWGGQKGYGALPMNWDEIMQNAKNTISRYYWGGVTEPGLAGKMKSQAARLNRPVNEQMIGALGMQEKIDLNDLATNLRSEETKYGEQGRQSWLNSMMNLAGMKPHYMTNEGVVQGSTYGAGNMIGDVSSGIGSLFSQYAKSKQTEDLYNKLFQNAGGVGGTTPGTAQSSLTSDFSLGSLTDLFKKYQSGLSG
jgi:hypothetical protein